MSALTRRVKSARLDARLEAVEADQRFKFRKVSLKPPVLLDRECPLLYRESPLAKSGILGAGRGSLNGSRSSSAPAPYGATGSAVILAAGSSDEVRGGLPVANEEDRGGFEGIKEEDGVARWKAGIEGRCSESAGGVLPMLWFVVFVC